MKRIFKSVLLLGTFLAAYSCVLESIDTQLTDDEAIARIKLECDALDSYTIQASKPQAISFRISSTTPWTIEGADKVDWLTVTPKSSSDADDFNSHLSEDIKIVAKANNTYEPRQATLTVSGKNTNITHPILLVQNPLAKIEMTPVSEAFALEGGSQTFTVESNLNWSASVADSWLTLNPASGEASKKVTVTATAAANESVDRSTVVTVVSGDVAQTFTVTQKGHKLEFLPVENPVIPSDGGSITLGVDATMDFVAESSNNAFTVNVEGRDKVIVSATWNGQFMPRQATITIKPASGSGDGKSVELTQGINFEFSGNCEVLSDGSVKISGDAKSRVYTKQPFRFVSIVLTMGDVKFGDKGQLFCATNAAECNIYTQMDLQGNWRVRQDGNLPNTKKPNGDDISTYQNINLTVAQDKSTLNALKEYRFEVLPEITDDPDYAGVKRHVVKFWYNGKVDTEMNFRSVYADEPTAEGKYWFGMNSAVTDGTWYIVKSCDITILGE